MQRLDRDKPVHERKLTPDGVTADLNAVADYALRIPAANDTLAVAGFCCGGGNSLRFATSCPDLRAAFVFYGTGPEASDLARIKAPDYGFCGGNDARVNATLAKSEELTKEAHKTWQPVIYEAAGVGFMRAGEDAAGNETNRKARADAWIRWKALLEKLQILELCSLPEEFIIGPEHSAGRGVRYRLGWKSMKWTCVLLSIACMAAEPPSKQPVKPSPVLEAMKHELDRSMDQLKKQKTPPYFLAYDITEVDSVRVGGSFGTLTNSRRQRERLLGVDLRVGSYQLDNTRPIRGSVFNVIDGMSYIPMPVEDDPDAIRALLWYQTDQKYKRAIEQIIAVTTNNKVKIEETDRSGDFSPAPAENYIDPTAPPLKVDQKLWEDKVRKYTAPFQRYGNIYQARAALSATTKTRWFVSSDGSAIQTSDTSYQLSINGFSKADDGMELPRFETFYSSTLEGLPSDETVLAAVNKMAKDLMALKTAPVMDAYLGPAILSGRAAGVFFHEVFGHRIEAQRQKRDNDGQTFRDKVGQLVLPDFLSVYSDPTVRKLGKSELSGAYKFDDQGVKARRVPVVENGVLKNFLLSRTPLDGFPTSNGHGRKEPGRLVAARQSNLIIQASKTVSREELKKRLIEEVKKSNLKYGMLFEDIMGGFTMVGRASPNAFEVLPVMVYRIYADGSEELVRGVDVVGTPLTAFSRILGADDQVATFNGMCGAESGMVPVSASSPGLLIAQLEVQKKPKSTERSPILGPPFDDR